MARILMSPLNWGMGHCTRLIPMVRQLRARGHEVGVACVGGAHAVLKQEFPDMELHHAPDYPVPYSSRGWSYNKLFRSIPRTLGVMEQEKRLVAKLVQTGRYDLLISDNRFGFHRRGTPSFFISHQLRYAMPFNMTRVERITEHFNSHHHKNFERVIIPDNPPGELSLTGKLGQALGESKARAYYAGILCSVKRYVLEEDIDYLVVVSGPQVQKRRFKEKLLRQLRQIRGRKVVVLGEPQRRRIYRPSKDLVILSYANRDEMARLLARARFIISRGGYTSVMEMAELGKRRGLFVPTPGQPEQEYLAKLYESRGWFPSVSQRRMNLMRDIPRARRYKGFPAMPRSAQNFKRLYRDLLRDHLE